MFLRSLRLSRQRCSPVPRRLGEAERGRVWRGEDCGYRERRESEIKSLEEEGERWRVKRKKRGEKCTWLLYSHIETAATGQVQQHKGQ
jgi:hypothetical protein